MHPIIIATLFLFLFMIVRRIALHLRDSQKKANVPDDETVQNLVRELECDFLTAEEREKLLKD